MQNRASIKTSILTRVNSLRETHNRYFLTGSTSNSPNLNPSWWIICFSEKFKIFALDTLDRNNCRGIKLLSRRWKLKKGLWLNLIRWEMQFGFVPRRSSTDTIFLLRREKYLANAFDKDSCFLICWVMQKLGIYEWSVRAVQITYRDTVIKVKINYEYSKESSVQVIHYGEVLCFWCLSWFSGENRGI